MYTPFIITHGRARPPCESGSKEPAGREARMSSCCTVQCCTVRDSFLLNCHPTSAEDMPPFCKPKIFTLSRQLSTCSFTLLFFGHHLLYGRQISPNSRAGKHKDFNTSDNNVGPAESFSVPEELLMHVWTSKVLFFC
jgi:hypothetical protein